MKLSTPASITIFIGILVSLAILVFKKDMFVPSLVILSGFLLASYNVNCSITGHCNIWAWFLSMCYFIYGLGILCMIYNDKQFNQMERFFKLN